MSEYFSFYLGRKNRETGMISLVGPYYKDPNGELKIKALYVRSRSFIDTDIRDMFDGIPLEAMDDDLKRIAAVDDWFSDSHSVSIGYVAPLDRVFRAATFRPTKGYLRLDEYFDESELDSSELLFAPNPVSVDYYVGLPEEERKNYAYVSFVRPGSVGYVCNCIREAVDDIEYTDPSESDLVIILVIG